MTDAPLIPLAEYIIERFKQQGVKQVSSPSPSNPQQGGKKLTRKVFGVPGDYQLELLDYFERDTEIEWVGNANELGAVSPHWRVRCR